MCYQFTNPEAVTEYLLMELLKLGYRVECNRSSKSSDSWYIKIRIGAWKEQMAVYLRISDHNVPPKYRSTVRYDFDICGSRFRKDAVTCADFLSRFALDQGIPQEVIEFQSTARDGQRQNAA